MTEFTPVEIFEPTTTHGGPAASVRLIYRPWQGSADGFGMFGAYPRIPTEGVSISPGVGPALMARNIYQMLAGANDDAYLDLRPAFIKSRTLAGARYSLGQNQAIKIEASRNEYQHTAKATQVGIEWSAVFP